MVVLFGGYGFGGNLDETWESRNGGTWSLGPAAPAGLTGRYAAPMAYDSIRHRVVLFGGVGGINGQTQTGTWEYDGVGWSRPSSLTAPPARSYATMVFDDARGACVMFGGHVGTSDLRDTWLYDGTWRRR